MVSFISIFIKLCVKYDSSFCEFLDLICSWPVCGYFVCLHIIGEMNFIQSIAVKVGSYLKTLRREESVGGLSFFLFHVTI